MQMRCNERVQWTEEEDDDGGDDGDEKAEEAEKGIWSSALERLSHQVIYVI